MTAGTQAVDSNTAEGLVCRQNIWYPVTQLLSNFVLMGTFSVAHGSVVAMPTCRNVMPSQPLLYLLPSNEDAGTLPGLRRSALISASSVRTAAGGYDVGGAWEVELTDYGGVTIPGAPPNSAIAMTYCHYP